jgi:succinyl-CoA synthetase beta subunit
MKIHEYQAKKIFTQYQIPVPASLAAFTPEEAVRAYETLGQKKVTVKAQVLAGGRGKAGGIVKAENAEAVREASSRLIGHELKTYQSGSASKVKAVMIQEWLEFSKEFYMGIAIDRSSGLPVLIFSEWGGVEIEEVAGKAPEKLIKISFDPQNATAEYFSKHLKLSKDQEHNRSSFCDISSKLAKLFIENDAQLVEINPLVLKGDLLFALDAKMVLDDNAAFRHPEYNNLKDPDEDHPTERRAKKAGLSFVSLEGNIGCLVNGAGLAMTTMDMIKNAGGEPANFLDVGGGANKDQVLEAFHILLEDKNIKAVLVNIFGGIMKCDIIAQALLDAMAQIEIRVPVIVRLEGTRVEEGRALLKQSKIKLHTAKSVDEAAKMAVQLVTHVHSG